MKVIDLTDNTLVDFLEQNGFKVKQKVAGSFKDIISITYIVEPASVILEQESFYTISGPSLSQKVTMRGIKDKFGEHGVYITKSRTSSRVCTLNAKVGKSSDASVLINSLRVIRYFTQVYGIHEV